MVEVAAYRSKASSGRRQMQTGEQEDKQGKACSEAEWETSVRVGSEGYDTSPMIFRHERLAWQVSASVSSLM